MTTFICLIIFISFYLVYLTSKKRGAMDQLGIHHYGSDHVRLSQGSSLFLCFVSLALSYFKWGLAPGTLVFFISLMTIASLVVLLVPMGLLTYRFLAVVIALSLICELFLF